MTGNHMWRYESLETLQNIVSRFCSSQSTEKAAEGSQRIVFGTHTKGQCHTHQVGLRRHRTHPIPSNVRD